MKTFLLVGLALVLSLWAFDAGPPDVSLDAPDYTELMTSVNLDGAFALTAVNVADLAAAVPWAAKPGSPDLPYVDRVTSVRTPGTERDPAPIRWSAVNPFPSGARTFDGSSTMRYDVHPEVRSRGA